MVSNFLFSSVVNTFLTNPPLVFHSYRACSRERSRLRRCPQPRHQSPASELLILVYLLVRRLKAAYSDFPSFTLSLFYPLTYPSHRTKTILSYSYRTMLPRYISVLIIYSLTGTDTDTFYVPLAHHARCVVDYSFVDLRPRPAVYFLVSCYHTDML